MNVKQMNQSSIEAMRAFQAKTRDKDGIATVNRIVGRAAVAGSTLTTSAVPSRGRSRRGAVKRTR